MFSMSFSRFAGLPKEDVFDKIFRFASVAQLVEQVTLNHLVLGSSPSRGTFTSAKTNSRHL